MEFENIVEYVETNKKEHFAKMMEENKRKLEEKSNDPYFKGFKPKMYFDTDKESE